MSIIHDIEYRAIDHTRAEVFVDCKRIRCSRFSLEHDANSLPYAEIEVPAKSDISDHVFKIRIHDG